MLMAKRFPFCDVEKMFDEMGQVFDAFAGPLGVRSVPAGVFPAINLYDAKDKLVVTAEIPGVDPARLELTVQENSLTLAGQRDSDAESNGHQFYRKERPAGQFKRTITLSEKVDTEGVKASYKNGVLKIEMPKAQVQKAKTIEIKAE